ncbi:MAG: ATP-binding cassette domain-containing protein [Agriterribacter sp.]
MVHIQNISKTFRQRHSSLKALDNISLEIAEGDIVGIIGSSGAGKSTLIRCVNLLEKPDQGSILVQGVDLTQLTTKQLAGERKKIGMIFQHFNLLSSCTVFENVALPLELDNVCKATIKKRVTELLAIVGLENKTNEYPKSLSGGQKQRVAIARALANNPHLLLCDEATSALDPATTQSILQLLRDINQRLKITILLITHEMAVVKAICNYVAVIDHGRLVASGALEELLSENKHPVLKQFITTETMTIPQKLFNNIRQEKAEGLFPLAEIELEGNISFDALIDTIYRSFKIPYKIVKADIEYLGKVSLGKLLLHLQGTEEENEEIFQYFSRNRIKSTIKGYV